MEERMMPGLKDAAIAQAESLRDRTGRTAVVYYDPGPDRWGRSGVFYVREESEERPHGSEVIYRALGADVAALLAAVRACLPDLEHYAATHGPGPDRRLAALKAAIGREA